MVVVPVSEIHLANNIHQGQHFTEEEVDCISTMSLGCFFEILLDEHHAVQTLVFLTEKKEIVTMLLYKCGFTNKMNTSNSDIIQIK